MAVLAERSARGMNMIGYIDMILIILSVCSSVMLFSWNAIVAKRYVPQQKCLHKWIGNAPRNTIHNFQPTIPTLSPQLSLCL